MYCKYYKQNKLLNIKKDELDALMAGMKMWVFLINIKKITAHFNNIFKRAKCKYEAKKAKLLAITKIKVMLNI